ncbi:MAG: MFS transporter, partial [Novosphingobium sp.]|nr:MFS transporter [Novosphingobium sp.]
IGAVFLNVFLNWIFIFGNMGSPPMGLTGAGLATLLSRIAAMLGVLPAMTLATHWVPETLRGRAMGLVNMPLLVMIVPLIVAPLLSTYGVRTAFQALAVADLALVPLLLGARNGAAERDATQPATVPARAILAQPAFWILSVAIGLMTGAGTMKLAHFIPLLVGQGRSFVEANSLLALSGGSGLLGSMAFGFLADRIGGPRALAVNAGVQAIVWTIFLFPVSLPVLTLDAILVGACGGGVQGAFGVAVAARFGPAAFGRAFSLFQISTLPFLFAMTPIASVLFERTNSYVLPMGLTVGLLVFCAVILQLLARQPANPENHIA